MKGFLNIFFTRPAKVIFSAVFFLLCVAVSDCQVNYFTLYKQDNESFVNAVSQVDDFDYLSSHYYKSSVIKTVESITLLCMNYGEIFSDGTSVDELLHHYNSIGDTGFPRIYEHLSQMKGLRFALVNHERKKIYSNISDINGLDSSENIRNYFGTPDKNLLIARSCQNPYFATDTFIEFTDEIRACAERYDENFDLYISFGDEESFREKEEAYRQLHLAMREKIEKLNDRIIIRIAILILFAAILLTVTGKQEKGGKTYPSIMNRLPNDLLVFMYGTVLVCISSLYRTALDMLLAHRGELDAFWFARSEDFYINRIKFCVIIFLCTGLNILCILKKQYKTGSLYRNTYIYSFIETVKRLKGGNKAPEKGENNN